MTFLDQNSVVGELVVQEVFLYYDGPRLFVAINPIGQKYLINSLSSDDQDDTWLAVALSDKRLSALKSRTLDVHDAFAKPELGLLSSMWFNTFTANVPNRLCQR